MADTEKKLKQLFKSAPLPELSADFTSNLMEGIKVLPKSKPIAVRPLIHPLVLWLGLLLTIILSLVVSIGSNTLQIKFNNFPTNFESFYYLRQIFNNYLITTYAILILIWFLIDYKLSNFRKVKLFRKNTQY
ncbi:MAG: hypothetical protein WCT77_07490 [Bacteroidota bacterium]|jgi:hypothetical protein